MSPGESVSAPADRPGAFPSTHWSMVVHAGHGADTRAQAALESLCRQYWYPLYVFVRRQGRSHHEAEDCTQEFLSRLLAADGIARARPEQGRFRTFLLAGLRHFLINEWHRAQAVRRGGGQAPVSLEGQDADQRFALDAADPGLSADQVFDRTWAHSMVAAAVDVLRAEYENTERGVLFATLVPLVWGSPSTESLAQHAAGLGLKEQTFTVALHRLRRRLGERLRVAVAETVAESDVDAELRHLIAALNPPSPHL